MIPGEVVLLPMAQFRGGAPKMRPALFLAELPGPYQDVLICGISTNLSQLRPNWDELMLRSDPDFASSGLHRDSVIRLSYLVAAESKEILGTLGFINPKRLEQLRKRLSDHLRP